MKSVVITHKTTGNVVAQVRLHVGGMNYTPPPAEWHASALRVAIDDRLVPADAKTDDYTFEMVPLSLRDIFSRGR